MCVQGLSRLSLSLRFLNLLVQKALLVMPGRVFSYCCHSHTHIFILHTLVARYPVKNIMGLHLGLHSSILF